MQRLRDTEMRWRFEQSRRDRVYHDSLIESADEAQAEAWKLEMGNAARKAKAREGQRAIEAEKAIQAEEVVRAANAARDLALCMERYAAILQELSKPETIVKMPEVKQQSIKAIEGHTKPVVKAGDAFASCLVHFSKKKAIKADEVELPATPPRGKLHRL
nr:hypothetical protein B0A51_06848 [Rachicladosporium sp. CCFEE 5018]